MSEIEEKEIVVGNKKLKYYVVPNLRGLARANYSLDTRPIFLGLSLVIFIPVITVLFTNIDQIYGGFILIGLFMLFVVLTLKITVVAIDKKFNDYIDEKGRELIKVVIAHEYGHKKLLRWPPPIIYIIVLNGIVLGVLAIFALSFLLNPLLQLIILHVLLYFSLVSIMIYNQRIEEPNADRYALTLTRDKYLVIRTFKSSQEYDKNVRPNSLILRFFPIIFPRTHPDYEERIKTIEEINSI